jgi:hypothetical protein
MSHAIQRRLCAGALVSVPAAAGAGALLHGLLLPARATLTCLDQNKRSDEPPSALVGWDVSAADHQAHQLQHHPA